jgi:hypothetical protein
MKQYKYIETMSVELDKDPGPGSTNHPATIARRLQRYGRPLGTPSGGCCDCAIGCGRNNRRLGAGQKSFKSSPDAESADAESAEFSGCGTRNHRKMTSQANPGSRQRQRAGRALGDGPEGLLIRCRAWAGLHLAIFFSAGVGVQAADGLCPNEGGARGRVASVNERLELILEDGSRLKIAGVDPPRPTPGDPELDVRARDRLAQWLTGQEIFFRSLEPGLDRWGRTPAFVFAAAPGQANGPEKASLPERRSSMQVSRATSQARRRTPAGLPCLPPRPALPRALAFGPIRIMRSSPRPIARPSPREPAQPSLLKAALPASPTRGRASCSISGHARAGIFRSPSYPATAKRSTRLMRLWRHWPAGRFACADFSIRASGRKSSSRTRTTSR